MRIAAYAVAAALVACGGKPSTTQLAPLPDDPKPAEAPPASPAEGKQADAPAEAPAPPAPTGPLEVKLAAQQTAVKLISKGKGKLAPLRYAGKAGARQQLELALDFASTETMGTDKNETVIPTIVLTGEAETKAVDKDGRADYVIAVRGVDARDVAGSQIPAEELKKRVLGSLAGLVISGSLAADGTAGDVTMRIEQPSPMSQGALEMVRLTLPVLPRLPAEPIGVGAKWQTTTTMKFADKIMVTQVTDYELAAAQGTTWSIKGTTVVSGTEQELHGGKISNIRGGGTSELTLAAGALYPTYKSSVETQFTASENNVSMSLAVRIGSGVTAK
jgi:hypothetical protein